MRSARNTGLVTALGRTGDGAAVIGNDGQITFWNEAAEDIFGCTSQEVLGRPCWEVFVGCDDNRNVLCSPACHIMSLACRREPVRSFDMRTRTQAGRPIWLNVSVLSADGARGPLVVHLFRDVTAAKELVTLIHERLAPRPAEASAMPALSRRELEVLHLLTEGLGNAAIAERLRVRRGTVRNHVRNLFGKLGVHSRLQAVAYVRKWGAPKWPPTPPTLRVPAEP
jgi:PAS domain S-box-containing protein